MDVHYKQLTEALHQRIAGQLHDEVSGNLFALRIGLFNLMSTLDPTQESLRVDIQKLKVIAQATMDVVAIITEELRTDLD
jgi:signal transduction histidine kinase